MSERTTIINSENEDKKEDKKKENSRASDEQTVKTEEDDLVKEMMMNGEEVGFGFIVESKEIEEIIKIAGSMLNILNYIMSNQAVYKLIRSNTQNPDHPEQNNRLSQIRDDLDDLLCLTENSQVIDILRLLRISEELADYLKSPELKKALENVIYRRGYIYPKFSK